MQRNLSFSLGWRLQKVIWTQWRQDAWELALVCFAFLFIFPPNTQFGLLSSRAKEGPSSLFLASPAEGSRAELRRVGVRLEI